MMDRVRDEVPQLLKGPPRFEPPRKDRAQPAENASPARDAAPAPQGAPEASVGPNHQSPTGVDKTPKFPTVHKLEDVLSLQARDLMTSPAIAASQSDTVSSVARRMLETGVHAMPVVDAAGAPVGMVSDGDLIANRDERRAWWLEMLAEGAEHAAGLPRPRLDRAVVEVMNSPAITIAHTALVRDVAEALQAYHIKRLPVVEEGAVVGVVSRTDLLRLTKSMPRPSSSEGAGGALLEFLESMVGGISLTGELERPAARGHYEPTQKKDETRAPVVLSAAVLRQKVHACKAEIANKKQASKQQAQAEREREVKALLDQSASDDLWRELLQRAETAADNGEHELQLVSFPADLCTDGGRMIDIAEEGWEGTLRGQAADLYARWRKELKPQGIGLSARIVSYGDGGIIGDIGLFLTWGE